MDAEALLADLDADQRQAVTTESRLVAVIAGAGSGKTRVLTRRVAYRIATGDADAAHTVVLTFTREAAGELRRRLPRLGVADQVTAGTFHSVCQGLLRQRWADTDQRPSSIITDRRRIVAALVQPSELDEMMMEVDWATARGITPDRYGDSTRSAGRRQAIDTTRVVDTLRAYHGEKRRRGVIDLDDLLGHTIAACRADPDFADGMRWRFRHVLVDEAQDLNPLQHELIDILCHGRNDLYLVGDPSQAIYGFNGSDPTLLLDVSERFPGVEVVRLPSNHRSTPQIVDAGHHALSTDGQRADIRSERPDGAAVEIIAHEDEQAEAAAIVSRIARLDPTLARNGQVTVLARTHAVLAPIRGALEAAGIEVRRNVDGPGSALAPILDQVYRIDSASRLRAWAHDETDEPATDASRSASVSTALAEVADTVLDFLREQPTGDGTALRTWVRTTDPFDGRRGGVELLTFHGAKGREWHTVLIAGCETGLMPHRSATTRAARAEETRLLYVALTRATDVLIVNWSERRNGYQRGIAPLLDGFESHAAERVSPPDDLRSNLHRSQREVTLERLREWRSTTARRGGILPTSVCSDTVLGMIADHRPASPEELDQVTGLGAITSRRLYDGVEAALSVPDQPVRSTITGA